MNLAIFIAFVYILVFASSFPLKNNIEDLRILWNTWMQKYEKFYATEDELEYRFGVFLENYNIITEWNSKNNTALLALNFFADLTPEEFSSLYTSPAPAKQYTNKNFRVFNDTIPSSWDWRAQNKVTPIKNQMNCPASYLFSIVASLESFYAINGGQLTALSEQQVLDCALKIPGCDGTFYDTSDTFEYAQAYGLEPESEYPYVGFGEGCNFDQSLVIEPLGSGFGYVQALNSTQLKAAVYQTPTTVVLETDQPVFKFYSKGVITDGCGPMISGMATVVGYGNYSGMDSFYVKNSWGSDWGVDGYVYISTNPTYSNGFGACGILEVPVLPTNS